MLIELFNYILKLILNYYSSLKEICPESCFPRNYLKVLNPDSGPLPKETPNKMYELGQAKRGAYGFSNIMRANAVNDVIYGVTIGNIQYATQTFL